jgi:hypothetical protein
MSQHRSTASIRGSGYIHVRIAVEVGAVLERCFERPEHGRRVRQHRLGKLESHEVGGVGSDGRQHAWQLVEDRDWDLSRATNQPTLR